MTLPVPQSNSLRTIMRGLATALLVLALLYPSLAAAADTAAAPEYDVKAAFLVNFVRYTTWPDSAFTSPDAPIIIGILGANPFGDVLAKTVQLQHGPRRIEVRTISTLDEASHCQLVFIAAIERKNEAAWLAALKGKPVLTVGESGQTIRSGGLLEFIIVKERVKFDASWPAMEAAGVKFSSDMLKFARTVFRSPENPP